MDQAKQAVDAVVEGVKQVTMKENKKGAAKAKKAGNAAAAAGAATISELKPPPAFIEERLAMFDRLKKEHDEEVRMQLCFSSTSLSKPHILSLEYHSSLETRGPPRISLRKDPPLIRRDPSHRHRDSIPIPRSIPLALVLPRTLT